MGGSSIRLICSGGNHVRQSIIRQTTVLLPPLPEQRRIAAILDKADAIRRKRREAIALTEELLRSTFLEMFGDPVTNPKGWPVRPLGQLAVVQGGLQVTRKRNNLPHQVPYLRVANVYRDRLALDEVKLMGVTEKELERVRLENGDVLFVEGHGNPLEIGRSSVWDGSIDQCVHQNHLIRARFDDEVIPLFVSALLNTEGGRMQIQRLGKTTSGLNTISTRQLRAVKIALPPIEEQQRFAQFEKVVREGQSKLQRACVEAEGLFHSLVQRAFRGEL